MVRLIKFWIDKCKFKLTVEVDTVRKMLEMALDFFVIHKNVQVHF